MATKVKLNIEKVIYPKAGAALQHLAEDFLEKSTALIDAVGIFPGFPNSDIIDTGKLRESGKILRNESLQRRIYYPREPGSIVPLLVHEGYTKRSGGEQPGRPWLNRAARELPLKKLFKQHLKEEL